MSDIERVTTFRASSNVFLLACIFVMLVWPWIFLTTAWTLDGIQMESHIAKAVRDHPQSTSFAITLFGNIVSIIISILFSIAVVRFAQEWVKDNDHLTVFDVSLILAFSQQRWPWSVKDSKYLLVPNRLLAVVLAGVCIAGFALIPPGTTSLVTPVPFNRTWTLTGTELDFSSNATDCVDWFAVNATQFVSKCTWEVSKLLQNARLTKHTSIRVLMVCDTRTVLRSIK